MYWDGVQTFWQSRVPSSLLIIHVEQLVNAFLKTCWHKLRPLSWQAVFWINLTLGSEGAGQHSWRHFCNNQSRLLSTKQISWAREREREVTVHLHGELVMNNFCRRPWHYISGWLSMEYDQVSFLVLFLYPLCPPTVSKIIMKNLNFNTNVIESFRSLWRNIICNSQQK